MHYATALSKSQTKLSAQTSSKSTSLRSSKAESSPTNGTSLETEVLAEEAKETAIQQAQALQHMNEIAKRLDREQVALRAKAFAISGFNSLQEIDRELRPRLDIDIIFDSDYLEEMMRRRRSIATSLSYFQTTLSVTNKSPLEGLNARLINKFAAYAPNGNQESAASLGQGSRLLVQAGAAHGWKEVRNEADFRDAIRVYLTEEKQQYFFQLQRIVDALLEMVLAKEEPACTLAIHAIWDLSVNEANYEVIRGSSSWIDAIVQMLSDDRLIYSRDSTITYGELLSVQQAAGAALLNLCIDGNQNFLRQVHERKVLSCCCASLYLFGNEACAEADFENRTRIEMLCSLIDKLIRSCPPPQSIESAEVLRKYSNFILCVLQSTQRKHIFKLLLRSLVQLMDPEGLQQMPYLLEAGEMRWSLTLCCLQDIVTHSECADHSDRLLVMDLLARCVHSSAADFVAGVYSLNSQSSQTSKHEGYQVINLSLIYHTLRCTNFSALVSGNLQVTVASVEDPLAQEQWRPVGPSIIKEEQEICSMIVERGLCALRGLVLQHARQSGILMPPGTCSILWRCLMYFYETMGKFKESVLATLASCCFLTGFLQKIPKECLSSLILILECEELHGSPSLALILRCLCVTQEGCILLSNRLHGIEILVHHLEAAEGVSTRKLLGSAIVEFSTNMFTPLCNPGVGHDSRSNKSGERKYECLRWVRGVDRISPHEELGRFGVLTMESGDDFDEAGLTFHFPYEQAFDTTPEYDIVSTQEVDALCRALKNACCSSWSDESVTIDLSYALRILVQHETRNLKQFTEHAIATLLEVALSCMSCGGVNAISRLLQLLEDLALTDVGQQTMDERHKEVSSLVQLCLYLQAKEHRLLEFEALVDSCLKLVWKLAWAGASLRENIHLLTIVHAGISQPDFTPFQRELCANACLALTVQNNPAITQTFQDITKSSDPALEACIECLYSDQFNVQMAGAQFILCECICAASTAPFVRAHGLRQLVEMAWQSENSIVQAHGLHALLRLVIDNELVQTTLARESMLALILLAQHLFAVDGKVFRKGSASQIDPHEDMQESVHVDSYPNSKIKDGCIEYTITQKVISRLISTLESNFKNRTVLYQAELRLNNEVGLSYETYELPWANEDRRSNLGQKNTRNLEDDDASIRDQFDKWMGDMLRRDAAKLKHHQLQRVSVVPVPPCGKASSKGQSPSVQRRLYKSAHLLWKPYSEREMRWQPRVISAKLTENPEVTEFSQRTYGDAGVLTIKGRETENIESASPASGDEDQSDILSVMDENHIRAEKTREERRERKRKAVLRQYGVQLREKPLKDRNVQIVLDRPYAFSATSMTSPYISQPLNKSKAKAKNTGASKVCLFHHIEGSRVYDDYGMTKIAVDTNNAVFVYTTMEPILPHNERCSPPPTDEVEITMPSFGTYQKTSISLLRRVEIRSRPVSSVVVLSSVSEQDGQTIRPPGTVFARFADFMAESKRTVFWGSDGLVKVPSFAIALICPAMLKELRINPDQKDDEDTSMMSFTTRKKRGKLKKQRSQLSANPKL